jgi:RHS repeat-associated protein
VLYNLNNRQTTDVADAAGNITNAAGGAAYDIENRLKTANNGLAAYAYNTGNKRVWRGIWNTSQVQTTDEVTFWLGGQRTATYSLSYVSGALQATQTGTWYYFAGKLIKNATGYVHTDRLGSIGKFYPYGQERTATTNGTDKFATYFRDSETGLDYADQRYHQPGMGRFLTADPAGSGSNWYAYAGGDPINNADSSGLSTLYSDGGCVQTPPGVCFSVSTTSSAPTSGSIGTSGFVPGLGAGAPQFYTGGDQILYWLSHPGSFCNQPNGAILPPLTAALLTTFQDQCYAKGGLFSGDASKLPIGPPSPVGIDLTVPAFDPGWTINGISNDNPLAALTGARSTGNNSVTLSFHYISSNDFTTWSPSNPGGYIPQSPISYGLTNQVTIYAPQPTPPPSRLGCVAGLGESNILPKTGPPLDPLVGNGIFAVPYYKMPTGNVSSGQYPIVNLAPFNTTNSLGGLAAIGLNIIGCLNGTY